MAACVTAVISHPRVLTGRFQQTSGPFTMRAFSMRHTRTPVGRTMKLGCVDHVKRNHSFRLICGDKSRSGATNWCERLHRVAGEELEQQRVADVGLLDKKTMRRAGHDRELAYRKTLIQRERVFGIHLIIVASHHEQRPLHRDVKRDNGAIAHPEQARRAANHLLEKPRRSTYASVIRQW